MSVIILFPVETDLSFGFLQNLYRKILFYRQGLKLIIKQSHGIFLGRVTYYLLKQVVQLCQNKFVSIEISLVLYSLIRKINF